MGSVEVPSWLLLLLWALLALLVSARPKSLTIALIVLSLLPLVGTDPVVLRDRSFYGSYTVKDRDGWRVFSHGTTIHGQQSLTLPDEPSTYYARRGPVGDAFDVADARSVGAVGLGVGTIAAYGRPGQSMTFFEIDPSVIGVASNPDVFTYLSDSEADIRHVVGDGRLRLEEQPEAFYDLLFLDAFTSDAIPVHLLTREAFATYARALTDDGVLMVHISNRVFDLEPVVAAGADALGWDLAVGAGQEDEATGATPSKWVALSPNSAKVQRLRTQEGWREAGQRRVQWTDDFSSVLTVLGVK